MTCACMPDGSTFSGIKNILPTDYFHKLSIGDKLPNDELTPIVWKK